MLKVIKVEIMKALKNMIQTPATRHSNERSSSICAMSARARKRKIMAITEMSPSIVVTVADNLNFLINVVFLSSDLGEFFPGSFLLSIVLNYLICLFWIL